MAFKMRDIHGVVIWNCMLMLVVLLAILITSSCYPLWALLLMMGVKVDYCKECGKEMDEGTRRE